MVEKQNGRNEIHGRKVFAFRGVIFQGANASRHLIRCFVEISKKQPVGAVMNSFAHFAQDNSRETNVLEN